MACCEEEEMDACNSNRRGARVHIETIAERHEPKRSLGYVGSPETAKANQLNSGPVFAILS
jgi:hypothetical protein